MNPRAVRYAFYPSLVIGLIGCSGTSSAPTAGKPSSDASNAPLDGSFQEDATMPTDASDAPLDGWPQGDEDNPVDTGDGSIALGLCNTSPFTAKLSRGGPGIPGSQVLTEMGARLVTIDTSCQFRTLDGTSDGLGRGLEGTLNPSLKRMIESLLQLHRWDDLAAEYGRDRCDGPDEQYVLGDRTIRILSGCPKSQLPVPPSFLPPSLIADLLEALASHGQAASGPVRYILVSPIDPANDLYYQDAPPWPLEGDPSTVALTEAQAYENAPNVTEVSDGDANALRALRRAFMDGEIGFRDTGFIPIEQPNGTRYQLFVRDIVE